MKKLLFYASAVAVLFSSCSKDATEDVAIQNGTKVLSASIAMEDEGQTRLSLDENDKYTWALTDALGVASADIEDANIPVINTVAGVEPAFTVSAEDYNRWLNVVEETSKANPLFAYFPYVAGEKSFTVNPTTGVASIELEIDDEQNYAVNSFYRTSVPAVGFVEEYTGANQKINLSVPTALLRVWVAGFGDAKNITLKINHGTEATPEYYTLAGTSTVTLNAKDEKENYIAPAFAQPAQGEQAITVNFGQLPEELKYNGNVPVHFVIPAGLDLSEAILEFATDAGDKCAIQLPKRNINNPESLKTKPNTRLNLASKKVVFGLDDKYLMSTEEEFLAYAYLSRPGVAATGEAIYAGTSGLSDDKIAAFKADYLYAMELMGVDTYEKAATIEALVIADELDFASYGKEWADAKLAELVAEPYDSAQNTFWTNVLRWYVGNNYAIEPLSYNAIHGASMTTIKNLNVLGSGLTAGASLSNLTLENVTVNAGIATTTTSGTTTTTTYSKTVSDVALIAADNALSAKVFGATADKAMVIKNVIIGEGNKVNAKVAGTAVKNIGGIYAKLSNTSDNIIATDNVAPIVLDITATTNTNNYKPVAGRWYAYSGDYQLLKFDLTDAEWDATQVAYPVLGVANKSAIEAEGGVSTSLINAGVVGKMVPGNDYVYVDGVSYWNGGKIANDGNDKIFSAEELAFALNNVTGVNKNIVITNNIDMQCNATTKFVLSLNQTADDYTVNSSVKTPAKGQTPAVFNHFTIKNVKAAVYNMSDVAAFFGNGTVENLTFSNFTIDVPVGTNYTSAAGIVANGSVKDVTVDGLTLNVAKNAKIAVVGGVVAEVATSSNIANVTANNIKVDSKADASAGIVAGIVSLNGVKSEIKGINVTGTNSVAAGEAGGMNKKKGLVIDNYKNGTKYAYNAPFGVVNIDCAITADGSVEHKLTVSDSSFGDVFAAGYWFRDTAKAKKDVTLSAEALVITDYNFVLSSNAVAGSYWNNIGFNIKK